MAEVLTRVIVNELSGTMDLESTLIRAESLFRRFQRTVELIDKKDNFPAAPGARQRKSVARTSSSSSASAAASTGTDKGKQVASEAGAEEKQRIISDELRSLLSRKVERLDKEGKPRHEGAGLEGGKEKVKVAGK